MRCATIGLVLSLSLGCSKAAPPSDPVTPVTPPPAAEPKSSEAPKAKGEPTPPAYIPKLSEAELATLAQDNNGFAFDLYRKLGAGNVAFSPASVSYALAMTYAGARGKTEAEMKKALHFSSDAPKLHDGFADLLARFTPGKDAEFQLAIANRLWGQMGSNFLPEYLDLTEQRYGAKLERLDFASDPEAARKTINTWVEERTEKRIPELLAKGVVSAGTRLVLTNAIYFKGKWTSPFELKATRPKDFETPSGKKSVPTMMRTGDEIYYEDQDVMTLTLPYRGSDLAMMVVLPKAQKGLAAVEAKLTPEKLAAFRTASTRKEVRVELPRFETTSSFGLAQVLAALGMPTAFSSAADFSGMTGKPDLFISAVIHKAFVKVDEEGSEAAAATAVVMTEGAAVHEEPTTFRADHPFLYAILDQKTGAILFLGRVVDPS